jgi:hypothetical protein
VSWQSGVAVFFSGFFHPVFSIVFSNFPFRV